MHKLVRGAIAGAVATLPMTLVMARLFAKLPRSQRYPLPPRLIMESLSRQAQVHGSLSNATLTSATLTTHFAYGAATGALFPYLERQRGYNVGMGAAYGVGVWAASYLGWIPAAGILTPATRHPARRNALMLAAHLVWGGTLAGVSAALRRPSRDSSVRMTTNDVKTTLPADRNRLQEKTTRARLTKKPRIASHPH